MTERNKHISRDRLSQLINWGHWFTFYNGLLAMMIGSRYLRNSDYPDTILSWLYLGVNTIGQFSFLAFIAYLICLFPLTFILPYSKILRGISAVIATLCLCLLLYDTIIFADYGLHLSPFAFTLAWADLNALLQGTSYIVTPLAIITLELTLANFLWKRIEKIQRRNLGNKVVLFIGFCFVSSHVIHIWADASDITDITRFDDVYPLSYPATAREFMENHGIESRKHVTKPTQHHISDLHYPLQPLQYNTQAKPNVLLITIESLRADMVNSQTMPFLTQYQQYNQSFNRHFSGGNQFSSGMFSLLYGLQGSYAHDRLFDNTSPVLTQAFLQAGYQLRLFSPASHASMNDANSAAALFDDFTPIVSNEENGSAHADQQSVANFKHWQSEQTQPWFTLITLKAPQDFDTPVGFLGIETTKPNTRLTPAEKVLFNQYRQSLHFIDQQLHAVLSHVSDDTIVIVTGINGKLFTSNATESDRNFSPQSVQVPLVIHWPKSPASSINYRTSHYGVAPTLMTRVLGCINNSTDYSAGRSLLEPSKESWIYVGNRRIFAIYQQAEITVIDRHGKYQIFDAQYQQQFNQKMRAPELIQVMREGRRLYNQ